MAKRGREAMAKRARELARQQRREEKQERLESRPDPTPKLNVEDETELLEAFARLNDEYASDRIGADAFSKERQRILVALGIEQDEES